MADSNQQPGPCSLNLFPSEEPPSLSIEQERQKRQIYESMNPRRRKFVDKIGYEQWDPFQEPKQPLDLRRDRTNRTLQDLVRDFMRESNGGGRDPEWQKGARECALGIIRKEERFQGIFDFCLWYAAALERETKK